MKDGTLTYIAQTEEGRVATERMFATVRQVLSADGDERTHTLLVAFDSLFPHMAQRQLHDLISPRRNVAILQPTVRRAPTVIPYVQDYLDNHRKNGRTFHGIFIDISTMSAPDPQIPLQAQKAEVTQLARDFQALLKTYGTFGFLVGPDLTAQS